MRRHTLHDPSSGTRMTAPKISSVMNSSIGYDEVEEVLARSTIASALDPAQRRQLRDLVKVASFYHADVPVVREGDPADAFYIVLSGSVQVSRQTAPDKPPLQLARLEVGQTFGEAALLGGGPRTATVHTAEPHTRLLVVERASIEATEDGEWLAEFFYRLAAEMAARLSQTNDVAYEALRREHDETKLRLAAGQFLVWTIVVMCLYTLSLGLTLSMTDNLVTASLCTNGVILLTAFGTWRMVSTSPYSKAHFGLVIRSTWVREIGVALVWTVGMLAITVLLKLLLIALVPKFADVPLVDSPFFDARPVATADIVFTLTYILLAPVQEMIARGLMQSSIESFLDKTRNHVVVAIVLSNLMFATNHAHLSLWFAVGAFVTGIAWGFLYARQRSLVGVAVSHALYGAIAMKVFGMDALVRM